MQSNIKSKAEEVEKLLMSQFVVESMGVFQYSPRHEFSEDFNVSAMQQQYKRYCLQSKANLVMDIVQPGAETLIIKLIKAYIQQYIIDGKGYNIPFMKELYNSSEDSIIIQHISTLAKGIAYKDIENIAEGGRDIKKLSLDSEQISTNISMFLYFVLIANDNYNVDDYNRLFVEIWMHYYENWMASEILFEMNGARWRSQFKGVVLFD